jgi:hypothetical protein
MSDRKFLIVDKRSRERKAEGTLNDLRLVVTKWFTGEPETVQQVVELFFSTLQSGGDVVHEAAYLQIDFYQTKQQNGRK